MNRTNHYQLHIQWHENKNMPIVVQKCNIYVNSFWKTDSDSYKIVDSSRLIKQIPINNTANDMKINTCQLLCYNTNKNNVPQSIHIWFLVYIVWIHFIDKTDQGLCQIVESNSKALTTKNHYSLHSQWHEKKRQLLCNNTIKMSI